MSSVTGETTAVEALQGVRVLDASNSVAGQFCGRLFADNGAATLLVEPPEGSPIRRTGPFAPDGAGSRQSTLFAHLNAGKTSVGIDLGNTVGLQRLREKLAWRNYWDRCKPGELPRLGPMFRMSGTPQVDHGPAPKKVGTQAVPSLDTTTRARTIGADRPREATRHAIRTAFPAGGRSIAAISSTRRTTTSATSS